MNDQTQVRQRSDKSGSSSGKGAAVSESSLIADRRVKLKRLREEFGIDPYGQRTKGLSSLSAARGMYDAGADEAIKENPDGEDGRALVKVAGRVVLHRNIGKLVFMTVRDESGDLQIGVSKKAVAERSFKLAKMADLGDVVVARGRVGTTKTGEVTVWAGEDEPGVDAGEPAFMVVTKSLAPPPEKWHGLQDSEIRYRKRYVDLYVNPDVLKVFQARSRIISHVRGFLVDPPAEVGAGFTEVETPMMQPLAGGAAARPFITHNNALDIDLYLRVAPELYLKRLLVGGMSRVFEINRNFRNEGIDHSHNPEFTMLELYQAFGDYGSMMDLTERMIHSAAVQVVGSETVEFKGQQISYSLPFRRAKYHDLFAEHNGFDAGDHEQLVEKAKALGIESDGVDHDVLLNEVWEETVEDKLVQPTFVIDYPASLCPLTKTKKGDEGIAERFELFVSGMELANAYTELNDPDVQLANFKKQLAGADDEEDTFRQMDEDFVNSLMVGMPPAGGLGVGIDRLVMLLTDSKSIRDVILFPLMRPEKGGDGAAAEGPAG